MTWDDRALHRLIRDDADATAIVEDRTVVPPWLLTLRDPAVEWTRTVATEDTAIDLTLCVVGTLADYTTLADDAGPFDIAPADDYPGVVRVEYNGALATLNHGALTFDGAPTQIGTAVTIDGPVRDLQCLD